jgi:hypothetical protein
LGGFGSKLVVVLAVLALVGFCLERAESAPDVVPGQFVYTVPARFVPPMIGKAGMAEIQKAAKKLHYPYYVVLVKEFDGETDDDAAAYIDNLATEWQEDPDFNAARSSIFLLSYSPRKYRFLAGSKWEAELGFGASAHSRFNAIFEKYVQSSRKDPKTGIIKMMQAVDNYLASETDPKLIAQRKEAEKKAEIARRIAEKKAAAEAALNSARDELRVEIESIDYLLAEDPEFLPADTTGYKSARDSSYAALEMTDPEKIKNAAAALRHKANDLGSYVETRRQEARDLINRQLIQTTIGIIMLFFLLLFITSRFARLGSLKREFENSCLIWEEKITNSQPKYLAFEQERQTILGLKSLSGRTKEVYKTTTAEVDDIFIAISAMRMHIDGCRSKAKTASFFSLKPLEQAISDLENQFTIDTGKLNRVDLFAPETRRVTLKLSQIVDELDERFRKTIAQWEHLKKAAQIRLKPAKELFPQQKLDEMLKQADEQEIPRKWLADHPLFGDDESDETLYTRINAVRSSDPVAYLEQLEELQAKESVIVDRLERLIKSAELVKSEHVDSVPDLAMTVLQPQDDPVVTLDAARREEARFAALLASRDDIVEIEEQAAKVQELDRKCVEQAVMAQAAVAQAENELEQARNLAAEVSVLTEECEREVRDRESIHSNLFSAKSSLINSRRFISAGQDTLTLASDMLFRRRHLDAQKAARDTRDHLMAAKHALYDCREQCRDMDAAKQAFEERIADLETIRDRYESRLRRYGRSGSRLEDFNWSRTYGPTDYFILLRELDRLEALWDDTVRIARLEYEEEQEQDDDSWGSSGSSWGSSRSSSSSSSGGSWGGSSSSSSSGGSWGGGSSSSSSSSSSSGGSW